MRAMEDFPISWEPLQVPEKAVAEPAQFLSPARLETLRQALSNILNTELAETTFAQIVDGLPTTESFYDFHSLWKTNDHPAQLHPHLCEDALERTRRFRDHFKADSLTFEPRPLQSLENTLIDSHAYRLALVELVAVACHQIAVYLFQNERMHHVGEYEAWLEKEDQLALQGNEKYRFYPKQPPVPFYHDSYLEHEQYPYGIADIVGYWAEAKIFGGVVLFDRTGIDDEFKSLYFHETLLRGPRTIYPLLTEQFDSMTDFLLSKDGQAPCPLPIHATMLNRPRYNPYHAMKYFEIYRDRYERRLPLALPGSCTYRATDYPEIEDQLWLWQYEDDVAEGIEALDEAVIAEVKQRLYIISPSSPHWRYEAGSGRWYEDMDFFESDPITPDYLSQCRNRRTEPPSCKAPQTAHLHVNHDHVKFLGS